MMTSDARKRLEAIEQFSDLGSGFQIAMKDLEIRGAEIYWEQNKVVLSMKWALKPIKN